MANTSTPRTNNVVESKSSRYTQGGTTDRYQKRVGWWERKIFTQDDTDIIITILPDEDRRPDKVANRVYGRQGALQWLVLQYNNIVDIETEFRTGTDIRLPSARRVNLDIMTQPTGGDRVE